MYRCEICKNEVDSVYFKNNKEVCEKCYRGHKVEIDKVEINSSLIEEHAGQTAVAVN
ncbi:hypothetical protein KKC91_03495 [bacterium]|nr:hypothetical protein [bacterium]